METFFYGFGLGFVLGFFGYELYRIYREPKWLDKMDENWLKEYDRMTRRDR